MIFKRNSHKNSFDAPWGVVRKCYFHSRHWGGVNTEIIPERESQHYLIIQRHSGVKCTIPCVIICFAFIVKPRFPEVLKMAL